MALVEALARAVLGAVIVATIFGQEATAASLTDMRSASSSPSGILVASVMQARMVFASDQRQITQRVIGLVPVDVMNVFPRFKRTAETFAHNESMLCDVTRCASSQSVWVIGTQEIDVSIARNKSSALPSAIASPSCMVSREVPDVWISSFHSEACGSTRVGDFLATAASTKQHITPIVSRLNRGRQDG